MGEYRGMNEEVQNAIEEIEEDKQIEKDNSVNEASPEPEIVPKKIIPKIETTGNRLVDKHVLKPWEEVRLKANDFGDIYGVNRLQRDQDYVDKRKAQFVEREPEVALALHAIIMEGVEDFEWLGSDAHVIYTTEYDDIANGTDFVLTFTLENGETINLAIDVTTSDKRDVLRSKIGGAIKRLEDNGSMTTLRYFDNEYDESENPARGAVSMPRLVIGTDFVNTKMIMNSFTKALKQKDDGDRNWARSRDAISEGKMQTVILKEMLPQLVLQLEASIHHYTNNDSIDVPDSAKVLIGIIDEWKDGRSPSSFPKALIEKLKANMNILANDASQIKENNLVSAQEIARSLIYIHSLSNEIGDRQAYDSDTSLTYKNLSNPSRLFA